MVHGIRPDELVRLMPRLKPYLPRPNPSWAEIVDAADWLRHDLGVSKSLWGEACLAMGRELAAVALAVVSAKEAGHFRTTPGGYFHGMVAKAVPRTLAPVDLTAIVAALAVETNGSPDAGEPEMDHRRQAQLERDLATARTRIETLKRENRELATRLERIAALAAGEPQPQNQHGGSHRRRWPKRSLRWKAG